MKRQYYTIIEMIAVISIAAVLMAIAVPAFGHLMRGNAPGMAAREIMGKLASARSYAAANKTYVAVVFPKAETNVPNECCYTSYRLCEITSDRTFVKWLDDWNHLPQGVAIAADFKEPGSSENTCYSDGNALSSQSLTVTLPDGNAVIANTVIFTPRGIVKNAVCIPIQIGTVDNRTFTVNAKYSGKCIPLEVRVTGKVKFHDVLNDVQ